MKKKVLGIIPARGGSKGIPRKNIVNLCGRPLIEYSIKAGLEAVESGVITKLIVSTDDDEIAMISGNSGAEVPFIRPKKFAEDRTKSIDFIMHAIKFYEEKNIYFDDMILLQPTSPLRKSHDIEEAYTIFDNGGFDSLISCYEEEQVNELMSYHKVGDEARALNVNHNKGIRRQEIESIYVRNGAIYIASVSFLKSEHLVFGGKIGMYVMPKERSVNIDSLYDLELAGWMLERNKK